MALVKIKSEKNDVKNLILNSSLALKNELFKLKSEYIDDLILRLDRNKKYYLLESLECLSEPHEILMFFLVKDFNMKILDNEIVLKSKKRYENVKSFPFYLSDIIIRAIKENLKVEVRA